VPPAARRHLGDLLGVTRLAADGTAALAALVEHAHRDIRHGPTAVAAPMGGVPGLVYRAVRGTADLVGRGLAAASRDARGAAPLHAPDGVAAARRDALLAALNGVAGDHLAATGNPLAISMRLLVGGRDAGEAPLPANGRLLVLVHGLCLGPRQWRRRGHDHGEALARDLGVAAVYLEYNTGLHVSTNGRAFADALEALLGRWPVPVEELTVVAHSMGGLVTRSACHAAAARGHRWPGALRRVVCLGTPHHGAPLERGGHRASTCLDALPYAAAYARMGRVRSAGITDLRHGNVLDADWAGADRFAPAGDRRTPAPLPAGVEWHAFAAEVGGHGGVLGAAVGDGLVPVASALGDHPDPAFDLGLPADRRWLGRGMHHLELLDRPEVYAELRRRLARRPASSPAA
jgi:hypothetical protein